MIGYHEIIRLPLLSQAKEWLGTIAKEVDLTNGLEEIELTSSLSLPEFRRKVSSSQGTYSRVERYMLSVVLYVILLGAFVYMVYFFYRRKLKKNSCCAKPEEPSLPLMSPNAGSVSSSNLTAPFPNSVLKQFD